MRNLRLEVPSKGTLLRSALEAMYYTQTYRLLESHCSGVGAIFTLHHVVPECKPVGFNPNRILEITSEFLDRTIQQVRSLNYDIVSLDEARRRLVEKDFERKFVCFTLDDGYDDNYLNAYPIFKKHNAPFTIYIATGLLDGTAVLWWRCLEQLLLKEKKVDLEFAGREFRFSTVSTWEKYKAYHQIYWTLRQLPLENLYSEVQKFNDKYGIDSSDLCRKAAMSWDMLKEMSESRLATIGGHTVNHFALSKLSPEQVRDEDLSCREILANRLGIKPKHFAYPYGDKTSAGTREFKIIKEIGYETATTTRKGVLFPEHAQHLQALPRISLNGDYQKNRYIRLFLSGVPFAFLNQFRHIDVN